MLPDDPLIMEFEADSRLLEAILEEFLYKNGTPAIVVYQACISLAMRAAGKAGLSRTEMHDRLDAWWLERRFVGYLVNNK